MTRVDSLNPRKSRKLKTHPLTLLHFMFLKIYIIVLLKKSAWNFHFFPQNKILELTSLKISKSSPCPNL